MRLDLHVDYTERALRELGVKASAKVQRVLHGLYVADEHETTEFFKGAPLFDSPLDLVFWESHYGRLTSIHAMAHQNRLPTSETLAEIQAWNEFYQALILGTLSVPARTRMVDLPCRVATIFQGMHFTLKAFFDEGKADHIRDLALGTLLHLLQDTYTRSHCVRDRTGHIKRFLCYRDQGIIGHLSNDDVPALHRDRMMEATRGCLQALLLDGRPFCFDPYLVLSQKTQTSGAGGF
jgi:hypothetical protein